MRGFLGNLIERSLASAAVVRPRPVTPFERPPVARANSADVAAELDRVLSIAGGDTLGQQAPPATASAVPDRSAPPAVAHAEPDADQTTAAFEVRSQPAERVAVPRSIASPQPWREEPAAPGEPAPAAARRRSGRSVGHLGDVSLDAISPESMPTQDQGRAPRGGERHPTHAEAALAPRADQQAQVPRLPPSEQDLALRSGPLGQRAQRSDRDGSRPAPVQPRSLAVEQTTERPARAAARLTALDGSRLELADTQGARPERGSRPGEGVVRHESSVGARLAPQPRLQQQTHTPRLTAALERGPTTGRPGHGAEAEPVVHVTIGRVEIRAIQAPAGPKRTPTAPSVGLADYLQRRSATGAR
jgi:hypothetical protein